MHLRKFLSALWSDLLARLSGGVSVAAAFAAAYFDFVAKNPKTLLWVASAICLVIAAYRVWATEHQALIDEQARNGRPKITGVIHKAISSEPLLWRPGNKVGVIIALEVHFANERQTAVTLRNFWIAAKTSEQPYTTDKVYPGTIAANHRGEQSGVVRNLADCLNSTPLEYGHHREGWLQFYLPGVTLDIVEGAPVTLYITDAFDQLHEIKGSRAEQVKRV